jgi:hypothetical protein
MRLILMITSFTWVNRKSPTVPIRSPPNSFLMRSMIYIPNSPIGTADPQWSPRTSIEPTAEQHMPLVPNRCSALHTCPAILGPYAKMISLSIASRISQAAIPLPICAFAIGPESNEPAELEESQYIFRSLDGTPAYIPASFLVQIRICRPLFPKSMKVEESKIPASLASKWLCSLSNLPFGEV